MFPNVRMGPSFVGRLSSSRFAVGLGGRHVPRPSARRRRWSEAPPVSRHAGMFRSSILVSPWGSLWRLQIRSHFTVGRPTRLGLSSIAVGLIESIPRRSRSACGPVRERRASATNILVHDESSFDIRDGQGRNSARPAIGNPYAIVDGQERKLRSGRRRRSEMVHRITCFRGAASRSYGSFQFFVSAIAAGSGRSAALTAGAAAIYVATAPPAILPGNGGFLGARAS